VNLTVTRNIVGVIRKLIFFSHHFTETNASFFWKQIGCLFFSHQSPLS